MEEPNFQLGRRKRTNAAALAPKQRQRRNPNGNRRDDGGRRAQHQRRQTTTTDDEQQRRRSTATPTAKSALLSKFESHPKPKTMDAARDQIKAQLAQLRARLEDVPQLERLENETGVPREYISLAGALILLVLVFFGISAGTLTSVVGFLYPALKSLQALEHRANGDVQQWLVYWILFSLFSILEVFVDVLLYWIPFYYAFKVAFLLWAMLPQTRGAKFLYDNVLREHLRGAEGGIDKALAKAKKAAEDVVGEAAAGAKKAAGDAAAEYARKSKGDKKDE